MTKTTPSFTACAALVLLGVGVTPLANAAYTFTDLGTLGGNNSSAWDVNIHGQIVGYSYTSSNTRRATLWSGGTVTQLGTLGDGTYDSAVAINNAGKIVGFTNSIGPIVNQSATSNIVHATLWDGGAMTTLDSTNDLQSMALAINNTGQIVGKRVGSDIPAHATVWNGGTMTTLGNLGNGSYGAANDINEFGQIVGQSSTTNNIRHATLWNGTITTDLGTLGGGGTDSVAFSINNAGQIVGYSTTAGSYDLRATFWNSGTITALGTLGGTHSLAYDINNAGQIVGWTATNSNSTLHATLWDGTTATDLNSLLDAAAISAGWELIEAHGINDNGWIVGDAVNRFTGQTHGFLLSYTADPIATVPEPETYAMLLAGLGLLGFTARRRK